MHVCVKIMLKGLKEALTVLIVTHVTQVERVKSGVCSFYTTLHIEHFTQFVTHVERVESVLCIQWPLAPARREGYCVSLPSWRFSCSPLVSLRRQFC